MRLATWNINSIRARQRRLLAWLDRQAPDVLCLQETKVTDDAFPRDALREVGYTAAVHGQKTYNGVAILSRRPLEGIERGLGDGDADGEARLIAATVSGVKVLSAYFPNGRVVGSDAFDHKLAWIERLLGHLEATATPEAPLVLAGDFNVATDDRDVAHPERWKESVLCHEDARRVVARLRDWGLRDVFERHHPEGGVYSWWDYRRLAFPKNDGLRIDHIYATESIARRSRSAHIHREERKKGTIDKPSDHAPVIVELEE